MATTSIRGSLDTSLHPSTACVSSFCAVPGSADLVPQQPGLVRRAIASKLRPLQEADADGLPAVGVRA